MNTLGKLAAISLCAALASCSLFQSDPPRLIEVGLQSKLNDPSKVPAHFVVTLEEARLAIPYTKYTWSIYADSQNYYLYPNIGVPTLTSSASIREYGHPLSGTTRHDIDRIMALRKGNRARDRERSLDIRQLEKALPSKHKPTP